FFPFASKISAGKPKWYETISVNYQFNARNQINTSDSLLFNEDISRRMSNGATNQISVGTQFRALKWLNFNPTLNSNVYMYTSSVKKQWDTSLNEVVTDTITGFNYAYDYMFSVPFTTALYGTYRFNAKKLYAIRHAMYPSVTLSYRPDFSNPNFGFYETIQADTLNNELKYSYFQNSITGGPGQGKSGLISFGLNNILEAKTKHRN